MKKLSGKIKNNVLARYVIAIISGLVISSLLICLFALLISKNDMPQWILKFFWIPIFLSGSVISGFIAGRIKTVKGVFSGLISSSAFSIILLLLLIIINSFNINIIMLLLVPLSMLAGIISSILSANLR